MSISQKQKLKELWSKDQPIFHLPHQEEKFRRPMKKRQQTDTNESESLPPTVDNLSVLMNVICEHFALVAFGQAGKVINAEEFIDQIANNLNETEEQDHIKFKQSLEQAKNVKPSNSGYCTTGNYAKLVEWTAREKNKEVAAAHIYNDNGDVFFCEDSTHCYYQMGAVQADITFNYANASAVESTTGNSTVQSGQLHRRGLPTEYNTLSSSASSLKDGSSMTLALTLMVILYMYFFNFKR